MRKVHPTVYCSTAIWLPLPMHSCILPKDTAYTPSLAKELLPRRLQSRARTTKRSNILHRWLRSEASRGCKSSVIARSTRILSYQVDSAFSEQVIRRVLLEKVGCAQHLIDKEIDQIYQMRGETIGHCDAAGRLSFAISARGSSSLCLSSHSTSILNGVCCG
jgi:hypothetical protein